ncbi:MAG: hypothetical protein HKO86_04165 [Gammaproteobacteria bacterium]|nr:hypothetical protein [Gammaproteobacteria bacterium]NNL06896.1 hypothetical protein [Gammaproteobacteria bacterium]
MLVADNTSDNNQAPSNRHWLQSASAEWISSFNNKKEYQHVLLYRVDSHQLFPDKNNHDCY